MLLMLPECLEENIYRMTHELFIHGLNDEYIEYLDGCDEYDITYAIWVYRRKHMSRKRKLDEMIYGSK